MTSRERRRNLVVEDPTVNTASTSDTEFSKSPKMLETVDDGGSVPQKTRSLSASEAASVCVFVFSEGMIDNA